MNLEHALIIKDLLTSAGYLDDADELFADMVDEVGVDVTIAYAKQLDLLIGDLNEVLGVVGIDGPSMLTYVDKS